MKILNLILVLTAFLVLNSCGKDEAIEIQDDSFGNKVQFNKLKVGQKSQYVFFIGEDYHEQGSNSYTYLTDTMVLEVYDEDQYGYLVREYLTPGSASLHSTSNVAFADANVVYYINNEGGMLNLFSKDERLITRLFQLSSDNPGEYDLDDLDMMEVKINGWTTSQPLFDGVLEGYTKNYRQLNLEFDNLNVLIDNRDVKLGGPGNTHIYSEKYGLVRATSYNASTGKGFGWDLLP
jgi:hypothetical protein